MTNLLRFKRKLNLNSDDAFKLDVLADYLASQNLDDSMAKIALGLDRDSSDLRRVIHILLELSSDIKFEGIAK